MRSVYVDRCLRMQLCKLQLNSILLLYAPVIIKLSLAGLDLVRSEPEIDLEARASAVGTLDTCVLVEYDEYS